MSCALFRFLAFSLTHTRTHTHTYIHLHTKVLLQTTNTSMYVGKYVRKKIIRFGYVHPYMYASGTYIQQYASSLNHPSSDTTVEQRKEGKKKKKNGKWRKKKKKTMPSRRIKSLEKKLGYCTYHLEGTCICILYTVLYLIAMT